MLAITATFQAKPGRESDLEAALRALIAPVGTEEGVLEYRLHRSPAEAGTFFFYEQYRDQAALDHHNGTPYLAALIAQVPELCAAAPVISLYEPLASIDD
jgi:quinol monooxygenase YgiN